MANRTVPPVVRHCQCGNHAWTTITRGYVTLVSPYDSHFLEGRFWHAAKTKREARTIYVRTSLPSISLHRFILGIGQHDRMIDHINGSGLDNRRENLRPATIQQNAQNGSAHQDSTSKFRGVSWYKFYNKWRAAIYVEKKQICLGYFRTEETAARIYDIAARRHFGEFARLNFPQRKPLANPPT